MPVDMLQTPFMSQPALMASRDEDFVKAMLAVELALAETQESLGIIPSGSAGRMRAALESHVFDVSAITTGIATGGNAAIPFVKAGRVALPNDLRRYWHLGATSQDIVDSALMLLLTPRLARLDDLLGRCRTAAIGLMEDHAETVMVGRTLMQQALPITFGVKVAHWALGFEQGRRRLAELALPVQFGGAVGVHSGWGEQGLEVMDGLAERLGLAVPVLPWHTDRQPIHALASAVDALAGAAEKLALDVSLLTQTELGEVAEPAGEGMGESSSMPHKRNPVRSAMIRGACRRIHGHAAVIINATAQPLERGLGEWHAEWTPLVDGVLLLEGALEQATVLLEGLEVNSEAMRRNLAVTGGAIMAEPVARRLTPHLGPDAAKALAADAAERARQASCPYAQALEALLGERHPELAGAIARDELDAATDPALYLGSSKAQVARAIAWLEG
ncbi:MULTISPECIES: class-II fumarase/aspartase family protein [Halomonadaceae]|uniref:class-II fumarase/aspartase family protein n=1 Tax=Halomonadaceae TaxID=28256 RepID=UPI001581ED72|nr:MULTISPECIES: adenylosuccinate lyase family protein [Halomonas]MDI4639118.1 adenylosuccinate lyase family protein [Halomonas sp. BMC7]NUJ60109.1 adenylosuccinate lyase family protein [Halomonas taeanensis]